MPSYFLVAACCFIPPACPDKVRITDFTIAPAPRSQAARPAAVPQQLRLTIKNLCSGTTASSVLSVPWRIHAADTSALIGSGMMMIPPGGTGVGVVEWQSPLPTSLMAEADPDNTLGESAAARTNNRLTRMMRIP